MTAALLYCCRYRAAGEHPISQELYKVGANCPVVVQCAATCESKQQALLCLANCNQLGKQDTGGWLLACAHSQAVMQHAMIASTHHVNQILQGTLLVCGLCS